MGSLCANQYNIQKSIYLQVDKKNNNDKNKNNINECVINSNSNRNNCRRKGILNLLVNDYNNISYSNNNKNINNENDQIKDNNDKEINIYFLFNDKKELYLTANSSQIFEDVEKELREKYNWINYFTNISFYYSNNLIINEKTKTISELGINNDETIIIKAN